MTDRPQELTGIDGGDLGIWIEGGGQLRLGVKRVLVERDDFRLRQAQKSGWQREGCQRRSGQGTQREGSLQLHHHDLVDVLLQHTLLQQLLWRVHQLVTAEHVPSIQQVHPAVPQRLDPPHLLPPHGPIPPTRSWRSWWCCRPSLFSLSQQNQFSHETRAGCFRRDFPKGGLIGQHSATNETACFWRAF